MLNNSGEGAWKHEFVACDAFLMKNIFTLTTNLLSSLSRINYLIISIENFDFSPRIETEEGIDKRLAARYYSRWRIIVNLLPLLKKAQEMGQDAKVMSILGAGKGPSVDFDDLEMKKNYGMLKAVKMSLTYNDLMVQVCLIVSFARFHREKEGWNFVCTSVERTTCVLPAKKGIQQELARREPDLSFVHIFPGAVKTRVFDFKHWAATLFWPIITPLIYLITVSPATCAEWMLYGLLSAEKGSNLLDNHGDSVGARKHPDLENAQLRLWEHTEELTKLKA